MTNLMKSNIKPKQDMSTKWIDSLHRHLQATVQVVVQQPLFSSSDAPATHLEFRYVSKRPFQDLNSTGVHLAANTGGRSVAVSSSCPAKMFPLQLHKNHVKNVSTCLLAVENTHPDLMKKTAGQFTVGCAMYSIYDSGHSYMDTATHL